MRCLSKVEWTRGFWWQGVSSRCDLVSLFSCVCVAPSHGSLLNSRYLYVDLQSLLSYSFMLYSILMKLQAQTVPDQLTLTLYQVGNHNLKSPNSQCWWPHNVKSERGKRSQSKPKLCIPPAPSCSNVYVHVWIKTPLIVPKACQWTGSKSKTSCLVRCPPWPGLNYCTSPVSPPELSRLVGFAGNYSQLHKFWSTHALQIANCKTK